MSLFIPDYALEMPARGFRWGRVARAPANCCLKVPQVPGNECADREQSARKASGRFATLPDLKPLQRVQVRTVRLISEFPKRFF